MYINKDDPQYEMYLNIILDYIRFTSLYGELILAHRQVHLPGKKMAVNSMFGVFHLEGNEPYVKVAVVRGDPHGETFQRYYLFPRKQQIYIEIEQRTGNVLQSD